MPDETPFGQDQSLFGRPTINYQGQPSMHDNLRLQRLVQHLASLVEDFVPRNDQAPADPSALPGLSQDCHQEIMNMAEAVFKELSLQSYRADKALSMDKLWRCLSQYMDYCATQATASVECDAAAEEVASAGSDTQQADLSRTVSTSTRLAALEQENFDMKAQIASLNGRLSQHAQHAEHLLAGTEAFFGPKAGTIIGQALEEEDSDSNLSFTSAQERSFSRPMSAGSSYSSAVSTSGRSRSVSPALHAQGLSRGAGSSKTLGPVDSGVSSASFETAREDALSRMGSAATPEDVPAEAAHGHSKRKALKKFLHKLRHGAEPDTIPGAPSHQGTSPAKPSLGTAADRAAAHQFARSLSQKGSVSGLPDRQAMPSMPLTPFAQASARGSPETPQQEVPPSMRVRSLSRQFSERAQQLQTTRSLSQSRQTAPAAASIAEDEEVPVPATAIRSSSTAGATSGSANVSNAEEDATHQGDGSTSGDEEEESEAAGDETDQANSEAGHHVSEDEAGMHTAHAGGSQDVSVYEDGTEGSKSHDADADDGSEYQDGSEGEEEQDSHSGDADKASGDEVLDEVVDDLAEEEGSCEDSLEDVSGSDDESID
ncbi:hypothetical protein WJX79_007865 [Trebouxia sp. C0005]